MKEKQYFFQAILVPSNYQRMINANELIDYQK
jgi:hypothetical protein